MGSERRRDRRFAINQLIELGFGRESYVRASGINISRGGLLCETDPYVEPTTRVFLSIHLPAGDLINCEGVVTRSEKRGDVFLAAISFIGFDGNDSEKLLEFVERWEAESEPEAQ